MSDENQVPAPVATAVLEHVVRSIVDDPDAVVVDGSHGRSRVRLEVRVGPNDLGRVIGKHTVRIATVVDEARRCVRDQPAVAVEPQGVAQLRLRQGGERDDAAGEAAGDDTGRERCVRHNAGTGAANGRAHRNAAGTWRFGEFAVPFASGH